MAKAKAKSSSSTQTSSNGNGHAPLNYSVTVSLKFLVLTVLSAVLLSVTIGRAARLFFLDGVISTFDLDDDDSSMFDSITGYHRALEDRQVRAAELLLEGRRHRLLQQPGQQQPAPAGNDAGGRVLPEPKLADGKEAPRTVYSSKKFDTDPDTTQISSSSDVHMVKKHDGWIDTTAADSDSARCAEGGGSCSRGRPDAGDTKAAGDADADADSEADDEEEEHLPAGQHLLIDIKNVDASFLNSESRLARAMVDVVAESELTLLSYHCHTLHPLGVSCVGVLLESHVSFHTWPTEGVITLDLFTCGSKPLVPTMPLIEAKFAVPIEPEFAGEVVEQPVVLWSHKLRGFRGPIGPHGQKDPLANDLGMYMLGQIELDLKREVASVTSEYQRIDIYEAIHPRFNDMLSYRKSLTGDGSYEATHPELYRPDRVVFLDGVMQSTLYGDEAYHEALVHPGMFAHPHPRRVAIIGGGEGATLREVLKHRTVERATMIEIDEVMVNVSHQHLPTWSDCSAFTDTEWCVEEPRADVRYEDALAWFIDRFDEDGSKREEEDAEPFDVIIMDALDPQDNIPFAEALYDNIEFLEAMYNGMTENGVIVMQLGESPGYADPADTVGRDEKRAGITRLLEEVGFESIHVYEESHSAFYYPWSYLVAFKAFENRVNWYLTEPEVELNIHGRILPTKDSKSSLRYFDGATMVSYQIPHKAFETVFCREEPMPEECSHYRGYHPEENSIPITAFEVKESGKKGFGLFATQDIPSRSMLGAAEATSSVKLSPTTTEMTQTLWYKHPGAKKLDSFLGYMEFYGFESRIHGATEYRVDSSILTFVNHGCGGNHNTGEEGVDDVISEATADPKAMPKKHGTVTSHDSVHQIACDRHLDQYMSGGEWTMRDIKAGEEITNNYLQFTASEADWENTVMELRKWCEAK